MGVIVHSLIPLDISLSFDAATFGQLAVACAIVVLCSAVIVCGSVVKWCSTRAQGDRVIALPSGLVVSIRHG